MGPGNALVHHQGGGEALKAQRGGRGGPNHPYPCGAHHQLPPPAAAPPEGKASQHNLLRGLQLGGQPLRFHVHSSLD